MSVIIGVRFREVGKIYYFDPRGIEVKIGEKVIVDTARGLEFGTVVISNREVPDEKLVLPLKELKRIATKDDRERVLNNKAREMDALRICRNRAAEHKLEMKVISAEFTFDNSKVLFYFMAEGRIDFRELVKDLAAIFRIRIELRQVGVRDETKIVGGIGSCGRPLCCHSYLSDFVPVSIKMAKEQNLSLNPQKISGVCGRLMCCLKNEAETYEHLNKTMPREGDYVETYDGNKGNVSYVNVLRQKIKLLVTKDNDEKEVLEYSVEDIKFTAKKKKGVIQNAEGNSREEKAAENNPKKPEFKKAGQRAGFEEQNKSEQNRMGQKRKPENKFEENRNRPRKVRNEKREQRTQL